MQFDANWNFVSVSGTNHDGTQHPQFRRDMEFVRQPALV